MGRPINSRGIDGRYWENESGKGDVWKGIEMKGIILAAGRGSRLGAITDDRPKCLVSLGGRTLIEWQKDALSNAGLDEIAIVRGYKADLLSFDSVRTFDNPRWQQTNMVESLRCAAAWLRDDECVVSYSDIVYHSGHVEKLKQSAGNITITYDKDWEDLWRARFDDPLEDAETFRLGPHGRLTEIGNRTSRSDDIQGQYMGLLKFSPQGWRVVEKFLCSLTQTERDRMDMTGLLSRLIIRGINVDTVPVRGEWLEVDSQSDLTLYESWLSNGNGDCWLKQCL